MSKSQGTSQLINKASIEVDSIASLIALDTDVFTKANVNAFYSDTPWGFTRLFEWDSTQAKTGHDGWSIINPDHLSTIGSTNWYDSDGDSTDDTGSGCWVRDVGSELRLSEIGISIGTGQTATVVNNNTKAIQTWINALSNLNVKGIADFYGVVECNRIRVFYDATDNPDFNSGSNFKVIIKGMGEPSRNREEDGTLFDCVETGDINSFVFGDGTTQMRGLNIQSVGFRGNNTGRVLFVNYTSQALYIDKIYCSQQGTGGGFHIWDGWAGEVKNVFVLGGGRSTSNDIGFLQRNNQFGAGGVKLTNITAREFFYGVVIGETVFGEGKILTIPACDTIQGGGNKIGIFIGGGVRSGKFSALYTEDNDTAGIKIANLARTNSINGVYCFNQDATEGDIVLGIGTVDDITKTSGQVSGDSARATQNGVTGLTVYDLEAIDTNTVGIKVYGSNQSFDNDIIKPRAKAKTSGVGTGIDLPATQANGVSVYRPTLVDFATDISNPDQLDMIVESGLNSIKKIRGAFVQYAPAFGNYPSATTTGSVTNKIEVFDETGTSIGFLPVYDSIT